MGFPFPPRSVRPLPSLEVCHPLRQEPAPQRLRVHHHPLPLGQLLRRQRRAKISILLLVQRQRLGLDRLRDLPVRGLPPSPMREPLVARLRHPLNEAPDVAWRQPQQDARLDLCQFLLHRLTNHMHPPEFLHTHDDLVLSDHRALLVRTGSLATKRTFLSW